MSNKCDQRKKPCDSTKICNPLTGRCVNRDGKIGKGVGKKSTSPSSLPRSSPRKSVRGPSPRATSVSPSPRATSVSPRATSPKRSSVKRGSPKVSITLDQVLSRLSITKKEAIHLCSLLSPTKKRTVKAEKISMTTAQLSEALDTTKVKQNKRMDTIYEKYEQQAKRKDMVVKANQEIEKIKKSIKNGNFTQAISLLEKFATSATKVSRSDGSPAVITGRQPLSRSNGSPTVIILIQFLRDVKKYVKVNDIKPNDFTRFAASLLSNFVKKSKRVLGSYHTKFVHQLKSKIRSKTRSKKSRSISVKPKSVSVKPKSVSVKPKTPVKPKSPVVVKPKKRIVPMLISE